MLGVKDGAFYQIPRFFASAASFSDGCSARCPFPRMDVVAADGKAAAARGINRSLGAKLAP